MQVHFGWAGSGRSAGGASRSSQSGLQVSHPGSAARDAEGCGRAYVVRNVNSRSRSARIGRRAIGEATPGPGQQAVSVFPNLNWREVRLRRSESDPVLSSEKIRHYSSARAALYHALGSLRAPDGTVVLVPAYHCGVEVEAALRRGYSVAFYRVSRDMTADLEGVLKHPTGNIRALMLTHYFGFPQDVDTVFRFCQEHSLTLIEDCAHGLYSRTTDGRFLGTVGHFGAFSYYKSFFLPNGGGLLLNGVLGAEPAKGTAHFDWEIVKSAVGSAVRYETARGSLLGRAAGRCLRPRAAASRSLGVPTRPAGEGPANTELPWYYDIPRFGYDKSISRVSSFLLGRTGWRENVARRRQNYAALLNLLGDLEGIRPVFPNLPEGVCPLSLPLYVDGRDGVEKVLASQGVESYVFGRRPHPLLDEQQFPEARFLASSVLSLPVHQQLGAGDLEYVAAAMRRALAQCRRLPRSGSAI